jgi:chromosome partitioning protein
MSLIVSSASMTRTISLLNMKGGVGKTTLAVNLAWYMHQQQGKNVLLVDLDPQFNATQYVMDFTAFDLHRKTKGTIADLLIDQPKLSLRLERLKKNPRSAFHNVRTSSTGKRFDLLPAELDLAWVVKNPAQMDYRLEKLLVDVRKAYDYVFIDCAPTDSVLTTMALTASHFLLVPMRPDQFSLFGYANLVKTIDTFRKNCPDPNQVKDLGVVFTQVMGNSTIETECIDQIKVDAAKQKGYVFGSHFKHSRSFIRALKNQTPIFETLYASATSRNAAALIAKEMETRIAALTGP